LEEAMNRTLFTFVTSIALVTLSACGGGDGTGEDEARSLLGADDGSPDPQTPLPPCDCPEVMAPHADDCLGGTWVETQDESGCPSFECVYCPPIAAPPPEFCPDGQVVPTTNDAGCVNGFDCVGCPPVMAPLASDCEGGTWVETTNDAGCVDGFECVM
jgi:hypothetical protein